MPDTLKKDLAYLVREGLFQNPIIFLIFRIVIC